MRTFRDYARIRGGRRALRLLAPLLLLAAVFGAAPVQPAEAKRQIPFSASFTTTGSGAPCGPQLLCVSVTGEGKATHLGRSSIGKDVVVQITSEPCQGGTTRYYTANATLTAANGDMLTLSGSGSICAGPGGIVASGIYTVTGGTGRFSGATGTVAETISRAATGPETTSLRGTISAPGS